MAEAVKIQINSLEAIERLIGNDNELEIDLRESIAYLFTKKHLKSIANSELMEEVSKSVTSELRKEFFDTIKAGFSTNFSLKPDIFEKVKKDLVNRVDQEFDNSINKAIKDQLSKVNEKIDIAISKAVDKIYNQITDQILIGKIDELVNLRIKEKLNL